MRTIQYLALDKAPPVQTLAVEQTEPLLLVEMLGENGDGTGSPLDAIVTEEVNIFENPIYQVKEDVTENAAATEQPQGTTLGDVLVAIGNVFNGSSLPTVKTPEQIAAEKAAAEQAAKRKRFAFIAFTALAITILAYVAFHKK